MNYVYFYYCDEECGFTQSATIEEGKEEIACAKCKTIQQAKTNNTMLIRCLSCGHEKTHSGNNVFKDGYECEKCKARGEIGFKAIHEEDDKMFEMELLKSIEGFECIRCQHDQVIEKPNDGWRCPFCNKKIKQKMSIYWEEGEREKGRKEYKNEAVEKALKKKSRKIKKEQKGLILEEKQQAKKQDVVATPKSSKEKSIFKRFFKRKK